MEMKKVLLFLWALIFICLFVLICGCSSDDGDNGGNGGSGVLATMTYQEWEDSGFSSSSTTIELDGKEVTVRTDDRITIVDTISKMEYSETWRETDLWFESSSPNPEGRKEDHTVHEDITDLFEVGDEVTFDIIFEVDGGTVFVTYSDLENL